jgi:AcrR family transcriptional regulator
MERVRIKVGRPPKGQAAILHDHIATVADALFVENGYGATSMAMIAARARIGKQTLYRRFPTKAVLFREVVQRRINAVAVPYDILATDPDPLGELKTIGRTVLGMVLDSEFIRLYRIIIAEAVMFPELACAASDNWKASFGNRCEEAIQQAQAMGLCRPGNPDILAQCFQWSLIGAPLLKGLAGVHWLTCEEERESHLEAVWRVFLEGVTQGSPLNRSDARA